MAAWTRHRLVLRGGIYHGSGTVPNTGLPVMSYRMQNEIEHVACELTRRHKRLWNPSWLGGLHWKPLIRALLVTVDKTWTLELHRVLKALAEFPHLVLSAILGFFAWEALELPTLRLVILLMRHGSHGFIGEVLMIKLIWSKRFLSPLKWKSERKWSDVMDSMYKAWKHTTFYIADRKHTISCLDKWSVQHVLNIPELEGTRN